jgi:excisionase family DNA binding protein
VLQKPEASWACRWSGSWKRIGRFNIMTKELAYELDHEYLTQEEVAMRFRVSQSTVKNWRDAGLLGYFQPPGSSRVLYPRETVDEFEKQHTKKAKILEFKRPAEVKKGKPEVSPKSEKEWRI